MKPAIVGISSFVLRPDEFSCLRAHTPAGVILFARNIADPPQLLALTASLREILPKDAVLMVDQEGGRVARLRPPHWRAHPPSRAIGALPDPAAARVAWLTGALIGLECADAGFDVVTAPVLDVASPEGHDVIGDRAFSASPERVALLGRALAGGLLAAGIQPVGKHCPGHGRALADSHLQLPELDNISGDDLLPFIRNRDLPWLMTAHIRYKAHDMQNPATQSATIIRDVIRAGGFAGVLVSDDLAMNALQGTPAERARAAIAAGCDIALHCSGVIGDTSSVLEALDDAPAATLDRLAAARVLATSRRRDWDVSELSEERSRLMP